MSLILQYCFRAVLLEIFTMPAGTVVAAGRSACSRCWIRPDEGVGAAQRRYLINDVMAAW